MERHPGLHENRTFLSRRRRVIVNSPTHTWPLVSIIIPYYNQPEFVLEAVASARQQTYRNIELIVVDDGSEIAARTILGDVDDVTILRTDNRGVSAARNLGFQHSSGRFIVFLDSDDRLMPCAVDAHLRAFRDCPAAGLTFGPVKHIDETGKGIRRAHICRPRDAYFFTFLESNPIASPGAAMISREAFIRAGLFNEAFAGVEDYDLYLRISRSIPLAQHKCCTLEYRKHNASVSRNREKILQGVLAVLDLLEPVLNDSERRRLTHARRRWRHQLRQSPTWASRLWSVYFNVRAVSNVPIRHWLWKVKPPENSCR